MTPGEAFAFIIVEIEKLQEISEAATAYVNHNKKNNWQPTDPTAKSLFAAVERGEG
jgi:hypothetical protein